MLNPHHNYAEKVQISVDKVAKVQIDSEEVNTVIA